MAVIQGMGPCLIPTESPSGQPSVCGRQIQDGEPIGTVRHGFGVSMTTIIGHKHCADSYYARVQSAEREKNHAMVQRVNQSGPGGAVDPRNSFSPVQGSIPLVKPEPEEQNFRTILGDMSQGAVFVGDLPEDANPADAVKFAETARPAEHRVSDLASASLPETSGVLHESSIVRDKPQGMAESQATIKELPQAPNLMNFQGIQFPTPEQMRSMMPTVDAWEGKVVVVQPGPISQISPDDAEDLIEVLKVQIKRARRQQLMATQ